MILVNADLNRTPTSKWIYPKYILRLTSNLHLGSDSGYFWTFSKYHLIISSACSKLSLQCLYLSPRPVWENHGPQPPYGLLGPNSATERLFYTFLEQIWFPSYKPPIPRGLGRLNMFTPWGWPSFPSCPLKSFRGGPQLAVGPPSPGSIWKCVEAFLVVTMTLGC